MKNSIEITFVMDMIHLFKNGFSNPLEKKRDVFIFTDKVLSQFICEGKLKGK
jgi:hypothetical protein